MADYRFPAVFPALAVQQPLGRFFVAVIPARLLLRVGYSHAARARLTDGGYVLDGNQRFTQDKRLRQIADYIGRSDSAFPNAIILAANSPMDEDEAFEAEDVLDEDDAPDDDAADDATAWSVRQDVSGSWTITIPTAQKLAAVVDGQHRLFAFTELEAAERLDMEMVCSVFFDLPKPFQAQLFATINSTQKRVDKSLTYELFGYNVAEEPEATWTPEKLAVFLTRKLNVEDGSPLRGRVIVAPKRDLALQRLAQDADWRVSTAVIVEGIMRLFSSNPRRDSNLMRRDPDSGRHALRGGPRDRSPMRRYYVEVSDTVIYRVVRNFLSACEIVFWTRARPRSFIVKTVGIQALFDVLRTSVPGVLAGKNISVATFVDLLRPASVIDFASEEFRSPSGSGRSAIRQAISTAIGDE